MPVLTLKTLSRCGLCACRLRGGGVQMFKVNKRSLVAVHDRHGLYFQDWSCPECGFEAVGNTTVALALTGEALAKVAEIRARRWPELAAS